MEDDMRDFRKFISLLLVFVLVLSLCPAGFAAEDVDGAEILEEAELTEPDIIETEPAEPGETETEELPPELLPPELLPPELLPPELLLPPPPVPIVRSSFSSSSSS